MRSVGKGMISFGLVSIPVKLYTTSNSSAAVSFKLLDSKGRKVKQQYVDTDGNVVERSEMLKGYEFAKGKFVTFTQEEIKAFAEASSESICIEEFVPASEIPATFKAKTYYLAPDKGGQRAYGLLAAALKETGRVGLARYSARGKQHLMAIEAFEDGLAFHQLHYEDEVVPFSEVRVAPDPVAEQELEMAKMLVNQISASSFNPSKYTDEVKARLEKAIDQKINGQEVTLPEPEPQKEQITDLVAALKASLGAAA